MQQSEIGCIFAAHLENKKTMTDKQKNKLIDLLAFLLVMVCIGGCAAYYVQESKRVADQKAKFRQIDKERREKIEQGLRKAQRHRDSVINTVRNRKPTGKFVVYDNDDYDDDDDYRDPYENPNFDDVIPGDEYDEEFLGSEGDPELYGNDGN